MPMYEMVPDSDECRELKKMVIELEKRVESLQEANQGFQQALLHCNHTNFELREELAGVLHTLEKLRERTTGGPGDKGGPFNA